MRHLIQGSLKKEMVISKPTAKWAIALGRKVVDTVYLDSEMTADEVRKTLIEKSGMCPDIKVFRA